MTALLNVIVLFAAIAFWVSVIWLVISVIQKKDPEFDDQHDDKRSMRNFESWRDRFR